MKRTYSKLSSELIQLDVEMGFLACSVRTETSFSVEEYHVADDFATALDGNDSYTIGFDD